MKKTLSTKLTALIGLFVFLLLSSTFSAYAVGLSQSTALEISLKPKVSEEKPVVKVEKPVVETKVEEVAEVEVPVEVEAEETIEVAEAKTEELANKEESVLPAPKPAVKSKTTTTKTTTTKTRTTTTAKVDIAAKQAKAEKILAGFIAKNPILEGVTIKVAVPPNPKWQGCTYYAIGLIIINPNHTASLEKIIWHEAEHIIDFREDGDIDHNDYWE